MDNRLTIDELIDLVQQDLTKNCALPKILPDDAIRRIATQNGARWFYRYYKFANQVTYYYVDLISMYKNKSQDTKFFYLPDEIESIKWIYIVNYSDMQNIGFLMPRNSVSFGVSSQPFVASINVSEWAESLTVLNAMADALASYSKNTIKFSFDSNTKRFEVLTSLTQNLILEVRAHIPEEALFGDPLFLQWVRGWAYIEMSQILKFSDVTYAGDAKVDGDQFATIGQKLVEDAEAAVKKITNATFMINKTR